MAHSKVDQKTGLNCDCDDGYFKKLKPKCSGKEPSEYFQNNFCFTCEACPILCKTCSNENLCKTCVGGYQLEHSKCVLKNGKRKILI